MKSFFLAITFGVLCYSCAIIKTPIDSTSGHVLYSEYSDIIDGNVTLRLISGTKFTCDTNEVIIQVDGIDPKNVIWTGFGLGFKNVDRSKGRYLLFPNCNLKPKIIISYKDNEGSIIQLKNIKLSKYF